jgi:hypothetical protein
MLVIYTYNTLAGLLFDCHIMVYDWKANTLEVIGSGRIT